MFLLQMVYDVRYFHLDFNSILINYLIFKKPFYEYIKRFAEYFSVMYGEWQFPVRIVPSEKIN